MKRKRTPHSAFFNVRVLASLALLSLGLLLAFSAIGVSARAQGQQSKAKSDQIAGVRTVGERGIERTTAEIMAADRLAPPTGNRPVKPEFEVDREGLPQNPHSQPVSEPKRGQI